MPAIVSAEPDRILQFVAAADDLDASLSAEVAALGTALDQVHRSCADFCGPFPRLDRELAALRGGIDQVVRRFLGAALRFLAADRATIWSTPGVASAQSFADFWVGAGPAGPTPPVATLLVAAGGASFATDDLREVGHVLLDLGSSAKSAVDTFGRLLTTPMSVLSSSQSGWVAEQLGHSLAARRVIGGLSRFSTTPLAGAAQAGLTTLTVLEDGNRLKRDGNPLNAWRHKGVGYLADLAGTGFDVTSTACANEPGWVTCGAAAVTGAAWTAAEAWQHRDGIVVGVDMVSQQVMAEARRIRGLASQALDGADSARQRLIDAIRDPGQNPGLVRFPPVVSHAIADTVERAGDMADRAVDKTKDLISSGWHAVMP